MASAPLLQRAVEDVELARKPLLVLDLERLEFIDSTGLRIILSTRKRCQERDQELAVTQRLPAGRAPAERDGHGRAPAHGAGRRRHARLSRAGRPATPLEGLQAPLEQAPLGLGAHERERAREGGAGLGPPIQPPQQLRRGPHAGSGSRRARSPRSPRGLPRDRRLRPARPRGSAPPRASRSSAPGGRRARRCAASRCAPRRAARRSSPAARRGPSPRSAPARSSAARPARICSRVPQRPILVGEQHELAVAQARLAARVVQQHQRQQPEHLGLVGHQLARARRRGGSPRARELRARRRSPR